MARPRLFGNVKAGDTIKVDGEKMKVSQVRRDANGNINVVAEGKVTRMQSSFEPDERAN
ncbi:MAG: hypothetical protein ACRD0W_00850 [Acidimicrobiales bacterium]